MIIYDQTFADYLAAPGLGSSDARLATKSIQLFRDKQTGVYSVADRSHHQIGRLVHMAALEPLRFAQMCVVDGPINESTGKPYGRDTKAFQTWLLDNPGKVVVEPYIFRMIERMPQQVRDLFNGGHGEVSAHVTLPGSGLLVKCRCDHLRGSVIHDVKTCDDVDRAEYEITKWKYWFQFGWYRMVMLAETGESHPFRFVFVEKKPPHRWRIVSLDVEYQMYADAQVDDTIGKILEARDSGDWSDRGELEVMASLPDYLNDDETTDEEE